MTNFTRKKDPFHNRENVVLYDHSASDERGSTRNISRLDFLFEILEDDEIVPVEITEDVPLQIYNLVADGKVYVADTHNDCDIPFQAFGMFAFGDEKNYCVTVNMDYNRVPKSMQESLWCNEIEEDFSKFLTVEDGTIESLKLEAFKHVDPIDPDDKIGMEMWNLISNGKLFTDSVMGVSGIVKYKDGYLLLRDS